MNVGYVHCVVAMTTRLRSAETAVERPERRRIGRPVWLYRRDSCDPLERHTAAPQKGRIGHPRNGPDGANRPDRSSVTYRSSLLGLDIPY